MMQKRERELSRRLSATTIVPALWGALETPPGAGPFPGVILLPGSSGWHGGYVDRARDMASEGFVTLALDYLAQTGAEPSPEDMAQHWAEWQALVRGAADYLQTHTLVSNRGLGLVGFSLGAFLAVSVASDIPRVGAVVEFYGGGGIGGQSLEEQVRGFPPVLIQHGDADSIVAVAAAYLLRDAVLAQGGEVELAIYPGAGHAFNASWSPWYSEAEAADSERRTLEFLRRRLGA